MHRVLGLDWGTRRIGVAISDDRNVLAVGFAVWPPVGPDFFQRLESTIREEDIGLVVVGYPLTLRGDVGESARAVDELVAELEARNYRTEKFDERFSSDRASKSLTQIGISQKKQRGKLDMSAAVLMLQDYLDSRRGKD